MDWDDALPWFLVVLLTGIAMAVRSLVADRRLKTQLEALANKMAMYEHRLFRLDERVAALAGGPAPADQPEAPVAEQPPVAEIPPTAEQPAPAEAVVRTTPVPADLLPPPGP